MPQVSDRRRRAAIALVFTVQDRRNRARALQEIRQRKAAILSLDTNDVAHRLTTMRSPTDLLDDISLRKCVNSTDATTFDSETPPRGGPLTYEQWADDGFNTDCWRPLLAEELYHPIEAEKEFFKAKYSKATKPPANATVENTQEAAKTS